MLSCKKRKMSEANVSNAKPRVGLQMSDRRSVLIGLAALISTTSLALAQSGTPKLIILPKGVTSPVRFSRRSPKDPHKIITLTNISLEGFLVCNGAAISRRDYKELFEAIKTSYGAGDGISTFALPNFPVQYRSAEPISGSAICPSTRLTLPIGVVVPFDASSVWAADPPQKP